MTRVEVLTPPGSGAIATVAVSGPDAWAIAGKLFRTATKKALPDSPPPNRFWYGQLVDGDEVVLAVKAADRVEVHCHGGRQVVRWVVDQFRNAGCMERAREDSTRPSPGNIWVCEAQTQLTRAPTLRTASILLDQFHGAFERDVREILSQLERGDSDSARHKLHTFHSFAPLGRHLVEPWKVVLAGPPNVGKSSLLNALAGFQRSVVAETAGTTRDVVTVPVAFEGWPVELADTAGLRRATEMLEEAGIERAKRFLVEADLILWLMDAGEPEPFLPEKEDLPLDRMLPVVSKCDRPSAWVAGLAVSARTGEGLPALMAAIVNRLVPAVPLAGAGVPITKSQVGLLEQAIHALNENRAAEALRSLQDAVAAQADPVQRE